MHHCEVVEADVLYVAKIKIKCALNYYFPTFIKLCSLQTLGEHKLNNVVRYRQLIGDAYGSEKL
jgi:hypothetical protein